MKTYCLIIFLEKERKIKIGKLGKIQFPKGYYVYVGSNPIRIFRHLRKKKKFFWHIDYFLKYGKIEKIILTSRGECETAKIVSKVGIPIKKFGCSDCRCESHLFYFKKDPSQRIGCLLL